MIRYGGVGILFLFLISCGSGEAHQNKLSVYVSIPPQKFFVERLTGGQADVLVLIQPGFGHDSYEPTPKQMRELSECELFFKIGFAFEETLLEKIKALNTNLSVIDSTTGIRRIPMETSMEELTHLNGEDEYHAHQGDDPHVWLSPVLAMTMVSNMALALIEFDSRNTVLYSSNLAVLVSELEHLHGEIKKLWRDSDKKEILVFHPAWGYFCREYGIRQWAVEVEGKEPGARDMMRIVEYAKKNNIKAIFVQAQYSEKSAWAIAKEIGAKVVTIDPLAEDYIKNMTLIADAISQNLE